MKDKAPLPTSAEITRRLRTVTELRNLCLSLGRAKRTGLSSPSAQRVVSCTDEVRLCR